MWKKLIEKQVIIYKETYKSCKDFFITKWPSRTKILGWHVKLIKNVAILSSTMFRVTLLCISAVAGVIFKLLTCMELHPNNVVFLNTFSSTSQKHCFCFVPFFLMYLSIYDSFFFVVFRFYIHFVNIRSPKSAIHFCLSVVQVGT